jgi:hypothetical protein
MHCENERAKLIKFSHRWEDILEGSPKTEAGSLKEKVIKLKVY